MDTFGIYGHELVGDSDKTACEINDIFKAILKSGL